MKYLHLFFLFLLEILLPNNLFSQGVSSENISGTWKGYVLILDEDQTKYNTVQIEMKLKQTETNVDGSAFDYIYIPKTYCISTLIGTVVGNKIVLKATSIHAKKSHPNYEHLLVEYDLKLITPNVLEGVLNVSEENHLTYDSEKHPLKIYLNKMSNKFVANQLYNYSINKNDNNNLLTSFEAMEKKLESYFIENEGSKKRKAIEIIEDDVKINETRSDTKIAKKTVRDKNITDSLLIKKLPILNDTLLHKLKLDSVVNDIKTKNKVVANTIAISGKRKKRATKNSDAYYIDDGLGDYYNLYIKKYKSLRKLKDYWMSKSIKLNKFFVDFVDTIVTIEIYNDNETEDTIAIFYNKKLVAPFVVISKYKPQVFKCDFFDEDINHILISNVSVKPTVQIKVDIKSASNIDNYSFNFNNPETENAIFVLNFNRNEAESIQLKKSK